MNFELEIVIIFFRLLLPTAYIFLQLVKVMGDLAKIYPKDEEALPGGVDDMTKLSYLHEPGVLQNLASRYQLNEIYVKMIFAFNCLLLVFGLGERKP